MTPMRPSRLLLAFCALFGVVVAIDQLAGLVFSGAEQKETASAFLTGLLLLTYAWIAPWLHERLALRPTKGHSDARKLLAVTLKRKAQSAGIPTPKLVLIEHPSRVAFGVGMPAVSTVFVTTGLCENIDTETLDFVIAHEVSHISLGHSLFQATVFCGLFLGKTLLGFPALLAPLLLLGYLGFMRQCEFAADARASHLTGHATTRHGLSTLAQMMGEATRPNTVVELLSTHPSFHRRIAAVDQKCHAA